MNVTNARATFGINAKVTPQKAGTNGTFQIGDSNETVNLNSVTKIFSFDAVISNISSLIIDVSDFDSTGSTAWTAGTAQVENATAAGTVSASGNASVVVTSPGMTGSPITLAVPVLSSDTATAWAAKVRTALNANAVIAARFTIGGSTTAISLTRKPSSTYTVNATSVPIYPANDTSLNISLDNGTCTGITTAATSTNTTAGVATTGAYVLDLKSEDFEGSPTGSFSSFYGWMIKNHDISKCKLLVSMDTLLTNFILPISGVLQFSSSTHLKFVTAHDFTIQSTADGDNSALVTITFAGVDIYE